MLSGMAKQPSGRTPKAESLFNRYTTKRAQNSATILREGSESVGLPFSLPVGFRVAASLSGCLQFGYSLQNRGFSTCGPCKEESDSRLSAIAERSMELREGRDTLVTEAAHCNSKDRIAATPKGVRITGQPRKCNRLDSRKMKGTNVAMHSSPSCTPVQKVMLLH